MEGGKEGKGRLGDGKEEGKKRIEGVGGRGRKREGAGEEEKGGVGRLSSFLYCGQRSSLLLDLSAETV